MGLQRPHQVAEPIWNNFFHETYPLVKKKKRWSYTNYLFYAAFSVLYDT